MFRKFSAILLVLVLVFTMAPAKGVSASEDDTSKNEEVSSGNAKLTAVFDFIDDNNRDGIRPSEITVNLLELAADGTSTVVKTETTTDLTGISFDHIPYEDDSGNKINYGLSVKEIKGYSCIISKVESVEEETGQKGQEEERTASTEEELFSAGEYKIEFTHESEKTSLTIRKLWEDDNNMDQIRPDTYSFRVYANDKIIASRQVKSDVLSTVLEDLYVYENGQKINYKVEETDTDSHYSVSYAVDSTNPYILIIINEQLSNYIVEDGVLTGFRLPADNTTRTVLVIPGNVKEIANEVFKDFTNVTTVTFASNSKLTNIDDGVFQGCTSLTSITFPDTLTDLGENCFRDCKKLKSLELPNTLTYIGKYAFHGMTKLSSLTIPKNVETAATIFGSNTTLKKITFSSGITKIPNYICKNCKSLDKITINGDSLKKIGKYAFYNCNSITSFTVPSNTNIQKGAFSSCDALTKLTIRKTTTSIGEDIVKESPNVVIYGWNNTTAKKYARVNKIPFQYTSSELKRIAASKAIYDKFVSKTSTKAKYSSDLQNLSGYVPQGMTTTKKYLVVSAYHAEGTKKSILMIYNKKTGAYIKKVVLPYKDHVGSLVTIDNMVVVGFNNLDYQRDYIGVIKESQITKTKKNKKVKLDQLLHLKYGNANFAAYDGTYYYCGNSTNESYGTMYIYRAKVKKHKLSLTYKYYASVPKNVQGLVVTKSGKKRNFYFSTSYGLLNDSVLIKVKKKKLEKGMNLTSGSQVLLPSMLEAIVRGSGSKYYFLFESGSKKYCGDIDNCCENVIKRICYAKLSSL